MQETALNTRLALVLVTAAILAAVIFSSVRPSPAPPTGVTPDASILVTDSGSAPPSVMPLPSASTRVASKVPLDRVTKLAEFGKLALRNSDERGQALMELQYAMYYCNTMLSAIHHLPRRVQEMQRTPAGKAAWEQQVRQVHAFCDEPSPMSPDQMQAATMNELSTDDLVSQSTVLDPASKDPVVIALAQRLANQVKSPIALEQASEVLIERGEMLPVMGSIQPPKSVSSSEARAEAQRLAVQMVACDVRGGCGPSGIYTFMWCTWCKTGMSLDQGWQQKYSPDTVSYARAVASKLLATETSKP
jgi:hypothetical protein